MTTLFRSTIITAILLTFTVSTTAQQRANNSERPRGDRQEIMKRGQNNLGAQFLVLMKRLDLSDEQQEQIKEIHLNGQKAMLPLRNQLREEQAKLRTLTTSDSYDENAVKQTIDSIAKIQANMMMERVGHHQEIRTLLTDEQRIKFDTFRLNRANAPQRRNGLKR